MLTTLLATHRLNLPTRQALLHHGVPESLACWQEEVLQKPRGMPHKYTSIQVTFSQARFWIRKTTRPNGKLHPGLKRRARYATWQRVPIRYCQHLWHVILPTGAQTHWTREAGVGTKVAARRHRSTTRDTGVALVLWRIRDEQVQVRQRTLSLAPEGKEQETIESAIWRRPSKWLQCASPGRGADRKEN